MQFFLSFPLLANTHADDHLAAHVCLPAELPSRAAAHPDTDTDLIDWIGLYPLRAGT